jgi:hypothetical protein
LTECGDLSETETVVEAIEMAAVTITTVALTVNTAAMTVNTAVTLRTETVEAT